VNQTNHRPVWNESSDVFGSAAIYATEQDSNDVKRQVVTVPILSLRPGESPRLGGEDKAHIVRLAESETPLPPILVDRRTMRVIDGMHRLMAASLKGQTSIKVEFFEGSGIDAFLLAVKANITHGLPLSLSDRRAAAARIIALLPEMSDRSVGETTGLAGATVAAIRRRAGGKKQQLNSRLGRDGKRHPLNAKEGRRRAAALLVEQPEMSLRQVARNVGISPATVRDVRQRMERGEWPAPDQPEAKVPTVESAKPQVPWSSAPPDETQADQGERPDPAAILEKLLRDPSLRHTERGRRLLRLLQISVAEAQEWPTAVSALPPHCMVTVMELAIHFGQMWLCFARELEERARIIDPLSAFPHAKKSAKFREN
jgi:ParB-like chromosome segregation protein Spo0J